MGEDEKNMGVNLVLFLDDLTSENNDPYEKYGVSAELQQTVLLPRRRLLAAPRACQTRSHANLRCHGSEFAVPEHESGVTLVCLADRLERLSKGTGIIGRGCMLRFVQQWEEAQR